ncbi:tRNA (adenosine(37)-N6)-threonylcarbamoyltransferase complex transferase subunit TsaD [Sulfurovum sp.]|jgi:N6-L-threonylcarbamoyladenine synthase|uniref:tRNA (adenosine(37)-N6)-threonylcarbamoyltransferase complex transferase subunit TsaD n=1 Tax=Sulfurovum sp. TaxID=1969726 RepID=UPI002A35900B|nr:tRNA (adenosine(37)-N6)-threonylcarbamoyltransferase complex transferase subunit TsaD [Sulfurovum sp.]MDD2452159.1 tRNA (adenosine(37)-N6)-threonylcarbamoyltransferase complex transferase subunit TsaD [Sulfurovum sp.]MDD3499993.1 tRNA (adenosine(37)-N6)-threonylcarbamoyltransferase complex transferase subunit TsaD [Sulfurovum sp.]MDY0402661.1 tRNA (adenosine(37)-N6)-threonylcarbamoyltransferase complex transferase subunit TsaD [Sulfurovum sp.]
MILSIESSCDDSSIAITEIATKKLLYHKKISQEAEHACYGGVVPELASRLHAVTLPKLLEEAKPYFDTLKAVAVTNQPGLGVTLLEGIAMAKTLASLQKIPLISVHHLKGHIYSLFIEKETIMPLLVLLISGGHTQIIRVESFERMEILATSMDDSVGESFDKVAKMMGLGYPGGPIIETLARKGDENRFDLPVPLRNSKLIAFSLSGLKNAVRLEIEKLGGIEGMSEQDRCDLSASFQKALKLHLLQKSKKIFAAEQAKDFAIVGGASANQYIRDAYQELCDQFGKTLHVAPLQYCSDNAAMIGRYALDAYQKKQFTDPYEIDIVVTKKQQAGMLL